MNIIQNEAFRGEAIVVDGNRYESCIFADCRLIYKGGDLPTFVLCEFDGVSIHLEDGAYKTVQYLEGLYPRLTGAVEDTLDTIERGKPKADDAVENQFALATGTNYGQMAILSLILVTIGICLVAGLWYGMVVYPNNQLEDGEPLSSEIPVDLMPALPDELTVQYDALGDAQRAQLSSYGWVDEGSGIGQVPFEDALAHVLDAGLPTWSESQGE